MKSRNDTEVPMLGAVLDVLAIPCNFMSGFFLGLTAPVAAIAAVVAGIRFLTGKVPFVGDISEYEEGERQLTLSLVPPERARELFEEQKEQIGGDIIKMKDEIQAIVEEAKAEAEGSVAEEEPEPPAAV
jgi:hypothetical protein